MPNLVVRGMPEELYETLKEKSQEDNRSLNQEVIWILKTFLKKEKKRSIKELRGLGKDIWKEIDAQEYVNSERESWD